MKSNNITNKSHIDENVYKIYPMNKLKRKSRTSEIKSRSSSTVRRSRSDSDT